MNTLIDLLNYGQSYWLDNLTRKKITGGEIQKRVAEQGLRGITSNPSIFNKAISSSSDYDAHIEELVKQGKAVKEIYESLVIKDVQDACDILKPVYIQSKGTDGFVSLEVSPYLARDTEGTMDEARRLHKLVDKPNCLIKIPGTKEGLPAIEQMLFEGVPVNVTLLFSVERYEQIAQCYIRAMRRRVNAGLPVENISSVASFFLSRIDVLVDNLLGQHIIVSQTNGKMASPATLMAKAGIASARLAYLRFKQTFDGAEWKELEQRGAHVQRPLWASTSTKNPLYNDVRYVEELIGPHTVNTLPDETIEDFADHGRLEKDSIEWNLEESKQLFTQLRQFDIDIEMVTQQLENEGIIKFQESYDELISNLSEKRMKMLGAAASTQTINPGNLKGEISSAYDALDEKQAGRRLFNRDSHLWKNSEDELKVISNRLGWLTLPTNADELVAFAREVKGEGYKYAVLLGMGGSSLCSEVARETYGTSGDFLELLVLDNTAPAAVLDIEKRIDLAKTLFIVASKSGTTTEPNCFFQYFYKKLEKTGFENPGKNFIAITDDATPLVKVAEEHHFRKVFVNPGDIGGRYSVLSNFGLLPMALMGVDIHAVLANAQQMKDSCSPEIPSAANPGVSLGAALGIAQKNGRDKVTFIMSPSIHAFGYWVEQLLAESTGKEGRGLVPVTGEDIGTPDVYARDRIFIHMYVPSDNNKATDKKLAALEKAGHPVVRINVPDKIALGGEYYRWEVAVSIAGMVIGIDPFNEPNVAESKKNTNDLIAEWSNEGSFKKPAVLMQEGDIIIYDSERTEQLTGKQAMSFADFIDTFTDMAEAPDYIALLCYFSETPKRTKTIQTWRMKLRDKEKVATTFAYGPRYLHSTGQLHKGGPATGLYIVLTGDDKKKLPIPGEKFGFGILNEAQSLGDFRSLNDKGRRMIYIQLGKNIDKGLKLLMEVLGHAKLAKENHASL